MNAREAGQKRAELGERVKRRYADRDAAREPVLKKVEEEGVFAAAGMTSALRRVAHMTVAEGLALGATRSYEAVIGADDSDPVNFLARGELAARAVCRLTQHGAAVGTGFLVAPGLILTNNHVISSKQEAGDFVAEFDYELDMEDQPRTPVVRFALEPDRLFVTSDADSGLDFTFVAVSARSMGGRQAINERGWIPLDPRIDKVLIGEPAIIVQHPRGELKRVAVFSAELVDKLDHYLHYTSDTDGGASGSCVMNRSWQFVALHHAATKSDRKRRGHYEWVNEGIRASSILKALQEKTAPTIGTIEEVYEEVTRSEVVGNGRPQSPMKPSTSVVRGGVVESRREAEPDARTLEATRIGTRSENHFANRDSADFGYKAGFLGSGANVPLPELPDFLVEDAAPVDGGGIELKYTHYSVYLSKSRRLPIMTAVNIDGKNLKKMGRKDREYEAADKWFYDPRVDRSLQLGPAVYDRTDFDFGHMVRREDPVWGDDNTARMANDDTFYMTNCAPQHNSLNTRTWLKLENAALESARKGRVRVTVLTGPVLSPQDPTVLGVQIPTAFWKIVAYRENGRLVAHGFMQWQTKLVRDIRVRPEALPELEAAEAYAVSIREIGRSTALDFGPLVEADVLRDTPERRERLHESMVSTLLRIPEAADGGATVEELPARSEAEVKPVKGASATDSSLRDAIAALSAEVADLKRALIERP